MLGVSNTSTFSDNSKGHIIHPNRLYFPISSSDTPASGEFPIIVDNATVTLNRDTYCTQKLFGGDAYFYGDVTSTTNIHIQNMGVFGVSTFNGPVNFTGSVTGLPVYTSGSLNLGNVANTAPSGLPSSLATQTVRSGPKSQLGRCLHKNAKCCVLCIES